MLPLAHGGGPTIQPHAAAWQAAAAADSPTRTAGKTNSLKLALESSLIVRLINLSAAARTGRAVQLAWCWARQGGLLHGQTLGITPVAQLAVSPANSEYQSGTLAS